MPHSKQKSKKNTEEALRDQIHALGGTDEDLELVQQAEKGIGGKASTTATDDVCYLTDPSLSFLYLLT
jgi:hypothetical protein